MKKILISLIFCIILIGMINLPVFANSVDDITPMYIPHPCHTGINHKICETITVRYEDPPGDWHIAKEYYCCCGKFMGYWTDSE